MRIHISPNRIVDCRAIVPVQLPAGKVWGQLRDFNIFARQEFFHADIDIDQGLPRPGAALVITHRFFLFRVRRVGRICRWKEGCGFAFSDLSLHGPRSGFPHTFSYRIIPASPEGCDIEIRVSGRWTATFLPRWIAWLWLRWIMQFAVQQVQNQFLMYELWLKLKRSPVTARR